MKKYLFLCLVVFCFYIKVQAQVSSKLSQKEAVNIVLNKILNGKTQDIEVFVCDTIVSSKGKIRDIFSNEKSQSFDSWFFFIDDSPLANWEHPCRYVFVNVKDGTYKIYNETRPPQRNGMSCIISYKVKVSDKGKQLFSFTRKDSLTKATGKSASSQSHNYAVIISGGIDRFSNYERYWNDCSAVYSALIEYYNYRKENIYTLIADGTNPAIDRRLINNTYDSSPLDLDGDGISDINYAATKNNINIVFNELAGKLTENDTLFIFTTDHGGRSSGNSAYLCLWNNAVMYDSEFESQVNKINAGKIIVCMGQCYSGGFIDNLQSNNRVITTACRYDEPSYAMNNLLYDEFIYYWISAIIGKDPLGNIVNADSNNDGKISMNEAFLYASNHDSQLEHPQYNSTPTYLGNCLSLSNYYAYISGPIAICNTAEFHIENYPSNHIINWGVSNNCAQIVSGQGTGSITLQRNYDGWTTLTATISYNGTVIKTLSKEIMVGTPSPSMVVYPISADGEWGYWRSDLHGNKIEVDGYSGNYPSYVVDLYRINNDFSIGQQVGHWTRNSLDNMTFGYYPPGWYYIEIVGVNDCGTSSPVGTEIESVDGSWGMPRMFSFNYHQGSEMLTVTQNPVLGSRQAVSSCEIQLWNGNTMLRKFRMTDGKLQIPMSGMKGGLYIVRAITDDGKSQQHKLMKK